VDTLFVGQRRNEVVLNSNLSKAELNQVHWRFVLLDFDGDGEWGQLPGPGLRGCMAVALGPQVPGSCRRLLLMARGFQLKAPGAASLWSCPLGLPLSRWGMLFFRRAAGANHSTPHLRSSLAHPTEAEAVGTTSIAWQPEAQGPPEARSACGASPAAMVAVAVHAQAS
jgi:hypothetical protein